MNSTTIHDRQRKIWLTTDTHFNHTKMIAKGYRPADFQSQIILNWNRLVKPTDIVIHLGDVICGRYEDLAWINEMLNGTKTLVLGNHDQGRSFTWYIDHGFSMVCDALILNGVLFTHEPTDLFPNNRWHTNVHGHLHSDGHRTTEFNLQPHHWLLSLEATDYKPVELQSFLQKKLITPPASNVLG